MLMLAASNSLAGACRPDDIAPIQSALPHKCATQLSPAINMYLAGVDEQAQTVASAPVVDEQAAK